jgi:predicted nucleotidyltransferase
MILHDLEQAGYVKFPDFVYGSTHYLATVGSKSYGTDNEDSDTDLCGFCIPTKEIVFPHLAGHIHGFDTPKNSFTSFSFKAQHFNNSKVEGTIYGIIKFFRLCANCNPSMVDCLFVDPDCVRHMTNIGTHVRDNRKLFLCKKVWSTYKGYAFKQFVKAKNKKPEGSRKESYDKYGYDLKFAYNVVRLIYQVEQILLEGDMDLRRNSGQLKSIRNGDWTFNEIEEFFKTKQKQLDSVYNETKAIPDKIQEDSIKKILLECLEMHFGSLDKLIKVNKDTSNLVSDIEDVIRRYR